MRTTKREMKRKGFTLVELLIVIVVIGVLSAMMMLSSTEAVSSAKASDVVSNLRNLKTAALAYYADHLDDVEKTDFKGLNNADVTKEVWKYMNNDKVDSDYTFAGTYNSKWFVWCKVTDTNVRDKLKARKDSVGLWTASDGTKTTSEDKWTNSPAYVGMFIR